MLEVTHGLLTALRLPKILLADSVNALLKEFTSVPTSVSSGLSKVSGANLPLTKFTLEGICNLRVFKLLKIELNPCRALHFYLL